MPCNRCTHILILYKDSLICPKCANLNILDSITASIIACRRKSIIRRLWKEELSKIQQSSLLLHIVRHREFTAREFWKKLGLLDIDELFSDTLFIKRVTQDGNPDGLIEIDDVKKAEPIIQLFRDTKRVETDFILINSCYGLMSFEKDFDLTTLTDKETLQNFTISQTEDHLKLMKSYQNYGLYAREDAEKKFNEHAEEYEKIKQEKIIPQSSTTKQFIERNYDTISNQYMTFLRNEIYAETFDLQSFTDLTSDPSNIAKFVNQYVRVDMALTTDTPEDFLKKARTIFKKSIPRLEKLMIFENSNQDIFPMFVRIKHGNQDFLVLSQAFTMILYIFLHAVITKDLFYAETGKRGSLFESKVKAKFEELGFLYIPNKKDDPRNTTLEIDGIAIKNSKCIVVECKNQRLPPLVESSEARKIMLDGLKGIVDGYKRTTKDGQRITKSVPSLPQKIQYVKDNLESIGLKNDEISDFTGVVITMNYPLLHEYKNIKFISFEEIEIKC